MSNRLDDEIVRAMDEGKLDQAEQMCRQLLAQQPQNPRTLHLAGLVALAQGKLSQAVELMEKSIKLCGDASDVYNNYGTVLRRLGRSDQAIRAFQRSVDLEPSSFQAVMNLARAFAAAEKLTEAEVMLRRAIAIRHDAAEPHVALASTLRRQGRLEEALASYLSSLAFKPAREIEVLNSIAVLMEQLGRMTDAVNWHRRAAASRPESAKLWSNYLYALRYGVEENDPERVFQEHVRWANDYARPLYESLPPPANDPSPERKLRIAYLSADFRGHSASTCMEPLIHNHDRSAFEVWCYSDAAHADAITSRFKAAADNWREVHGLPDERVAQMIRRDAIDVLIDHTGHMGNNRMMVFARRAAPVQVAFPGYPGTTGLEVLDAFVTDAYQDPPGAERFYTERPSRFVGSPRCYRPPRDVPEPGPLPADENGFITFGVLQRPAKLTEHMFSLWSRILKAVPNSRLLMLLGSGGSGEGCFVDLLRRYDVERARVEFIGRQKRDDYYRLFGRIDVTLDTLPYNGCATTLDSLWMGAPVVTLAGKTYVARVGASIVSNAGLPELVGTSDSEYLRIAVELSGDTSRLRSIRQSLRQRMKQCPLLDGRGVTAELERACRTLWRQWCARQRQGRQSGSILGESLG